MRSERRDGSRSSALGFGLGLLTAGFYERGEDTCTTKCMYNQGIHVHV
jgi:hypothetical protein